MNNQYVVLEPSGMIKTIDGGDYKDTYELLKDNVKGCIECVSWVKPFAEQGIDLWINDEGKLLDLELSLAITNEGNIVEVLNGNIVFARSNFEGETLPLNDEDVKLIKKTLQSASALIGFNNPFTGTTLMNVVPVVES